MTEEKQEPIPLEEWTPDPNKMSPEEAGDKGAMIFERIKEIYSLVDWDSDDDTPDPYIQIVIHKSGQLLVKTYKDDEPTEFKMDDLLE